jgi:S-DNA-T family DNA segregation ATPase FtsK/SpoIIIE
MEKRKNSKSTKPTGTSGLSQQRKLEMLGVVIMGIAVLIAVSIITYNDSDLAHIQAIGLSVLSSGAEEAQRVRNGLGELGAWISHVFVNRGFGYFSLIIPLLTLLYGWYVFRGKPLLRLNGITMLGTYVMFLTATIAGYLTTWLGQGVESGFNWAGSVGMSLSALLMRFTGQVGTPIILGILVLVTGLFLIDKDVQGMIDRIKIWNQNRRSKAAAKAELRRAERAVKQAKDVFEDENATRPVRRQITPDENSEKSGTPEKTTKSNAAVHPKETLEEAKEAAIRARIEESNRRMEERRLAELKEQQKLAETPPRAILDKPVEEITTRSDGVEVKVFVGEEDEQASDDDLTRRQKSLEREIPNIRYSFPTIDLLDVPPNEGKAIDYAEIDEKKQIILDKLGRHGIDILAIDAIVGPTVTLYELTPAPDVKISRIESYADDLKMAMAVHGLRIIAPIPGKAAVGIEVPNHKRETVFAKSVINSRKFVETDMDLPVAFGKTIENEIFMIDLTKMPHLLIAGATGSGKSVGINTILTCLLYKCHPESLKFVLIDPKKIELSLYHNIKNHFLATLPHFEEPIITDTSQVLEILNSVCKEMDDRYDLLKMAMVRDLKAYNLKYKAGQLEPDLGHKYLPYIVVIIDELADLMITAGKQIEEPIARIAQLARAVGIHLVVATQRPSVNVITGTIKANFPARIAYKVASKVDSRTILDTMGADQLVGRGDMLFSAGGPMIRIQNAFVSTEEVERITSFIGDQRGYDRRYMLPVVEDPNNESASLSDIEERDTLFEEAARVIVMHQQGSVSLLQRKLKVGYGRAGRIIDQLFNAGIVGKFQGSSARQVLIADEEELAQHLSDLDQM